MVDIIDLVLPQGNGYRIGAYYHDGSMDLISIQAGGFEHHSAIEFVGSTFTLRVADLTRPSQRYPAHDPASFGPSFSLTVIPEPTADVFLAVLGFVGVTIRRRKQ
jgi:hypothetical protein